MEEKPRYLGLTELVEEISHQLAWAPLKPNYRSKEGLKGTIASIVKEFLETKLRPLDLRYEVWQRRVEEEGGIEPLYVFGADFAPDLVIDIEDEPTLAIVLTLVKRDIDLPVKLGCAIGQALLYCHQYPAIITLVLHLGKGQEYKHWKDREIQQDLWSTHKIRLVFR